MKLTIKTLATAVALACASTSAMAGGPSGFGGSRNGGGTPRPNFNSGAGRSLPVGQANGQQPIRNRGPITGPLQPVGTTPRNTTPSNNGFHHMGPGSGLAAPVSGNGVIRSGTPRPINSNIPSGGQLSNFRPMTPPGPPPQINPGTLANLNGTGRPRPNTGNLSQSTIDAIRQIGGDPIKRPGTGGGPSNTQPPTVTPTPPVTPPTTPPPTSRPPVVINLPPINIGGGIDPGFGGGSGSAGDAGFGPAPVETTPVTAPEAPMAADKAVTEETPVEKKATAEEIDLEIVLVQLIDAGNEKLGPLYRVVVGNRSDVDLDTPARVLLVATKDGQPTDDSPFVVNEVKRIRAGKVAVLDVRLSANVNTLVKSEHGATSPFTTLFALIEAPAGYTDSDEQNNLTVLNRTAIQSVAADSETTTAKLVSAK